MQDFIQLCDSKENPLMRALAKIMQARARQHVLSDASNSSKGQICERF